MSAAEIPLIDLSLGEPCYGPPREACLAAAELALAGGGGYLPPAGLPRLRALLAAKLRDENAIAAEPNRVVVTAGASLALFSAFGSICQAGDTVLLPEPGFPLYEKMVRTQHLRPVRYRLRAERGFEPDWGVIDDVAPRSRILVWSFPSNPVGAVARRRWVERLARVARAQPELWVASDEVYEAAVYRGAHLSPASVPALAGRCVSIFSFSKSYGMTGWRVGYLHAPTPELADAIADRHWSAAMSASTIAQHAAAVALSASSEYRQEVLGLLAANRRSALAALEQTAIRPRSPDAGFFLWLDTSRIGTTGRQFVAECEREFGVRLSPGSFYGPSADAYIRVSFAVDPKTLAEGLQRLIAAIEKSAENLPAALVAIRGAPSGR